MKTILIVEDTVFNLDLLTQLLEDDYLVISAETGEAGLEKAIADRPDLILMDMSLPVMDGWIASRRIKETPGLARVPIIGLSAHAMDGDRQKAIDHGCDDYLTKPIDEDMLLSTIEKLLGE